MIRALILCTGNSCRSQMAEAFLNDFGRGMIEALSAGTAPAEKTHPLAIRAMAEIGYEISTVRPKSVGDFIRQSFDYVITVCDNARESCPIFTGNVKHRLHFGFEDPAEAVGDEAERLEIFRRIRDEIKNKFQEFADSIL